MQLDLERGAWTRGGPLPGADRAGFGSVYEAAGPDGEQVVAKFVEKAPDAGRELLISDALQVGAFEHVVPVLDHGEHGDSWVIIMPRASSSLQRHFEDHAGKLDLNEIMQILTDVATGLDAINETVVHRDLKPANVLLLDDGWALADFGIARYVDAATDPRDAQILHDNALRLARAIPPGARHLGERHLLVRRDGLSTRVRRSSIRRPKSRRLRTSTPPGDPATSKGRPQPSPHPH